MTVKQKKTKEKDKGKVVLSNYLIIPKKRLSKKVLDKLTVVNPKYAEAARLGYPTAVKKKNKTTGKTYWEPIPKVIELYREEEGNIYLPRGYYSMQEIKDRGGCIDERVDGKPISIKDEIKLRTYQKKPVELFVNNKIDLLLAEPGSGKTVMAIKIISKCKVRTLVLVNTLVLARQWKNALLKFTNLTSSDIGLVAGGKIDTGKVLIGTVQTILSLERHSSKYTTWAKTFGLVILDEVHVHGALQFQRAGAMFSAKRRLGITASSDRLDNINIQKLHVGKRELKVSQPGRYVTQVVFVKTTIKPPRRGTDLMPMYHEDGSIKDVRDYRMNSFNDFCHWITTSKTRNFIIKSIVQKALKEGRHVAVLTHRVAHAEELAELLKRYKPFVFHGKSLAEERGELIIATYQKLKLGWDYGRLDTLVIATPIAKKTDVEQSVGRIERVGNPDKKQPKVFYVFDTFLGLSMGLKCKAKTVMIRTLGYSVEKKVLEINYKKGDEM